jgi:leucyl aminopeptidase
MRTPTQRFGVSLFLLTSCLAAGGRALAASPNFVELSPHQSTDLRQQSFKPGGRWVEMDRRLAAFLPAGLIEVVGLREMRSGEQTQEQVLVWVDATEVEGLSEKIHEITGRCGGWVDITDEDPQILAQSILGEKPRLDLPQVREADPKVRSAVSQVREQNLQTFVQEYSQQFRTRSARGSGARQVSEYLRSRWMALVTQAGRSDISVDLVAPPEGYTQANVRLTIPGSDPQAPRLILGGHLDSISYGGTGAPGADDDASGISALTEVLRVLLEQNLRPKNTLEVVGYAAEELGLLGSRALAEQYRREQVAVRGVLQLDMVGYPGSTEQGDAAMVFIVDHSSPELTEWTRRLAEIYVGGRILEDDCGYACSDHASWSRYGYPSVFPFEALKDQMNQRIHSPEDRWDGILDSRHAAKFARLGVAFALHLTQ